MTTGETLDWAQTTEQAVLDHALRLAPAHGWSWPMARAAGAAAGLSEGETDLLLPQGPKDLAALACRRHDQQCLAALSDVEPMSLKVRERIARGLEARLAVALAGAAAERRLAGFLALPQNLPLAGRLAWASADSLWRWAGDTATDENHYTKRAILSGVLATALAIGLSEGQDGAFAYVQRRIDDVMAFERWKATTAFRPQAALTGLASALGRLRYPSP
ncbi:COQ9 family protein [Phenylobacterium immobile]|uniref:COQ9 family protein n=1 Tax=Phenylobacterium immobile TaxID=21 RepID=UPI000AA3BFE0|nr:COQ9 family protein [Phenylobacterium immobile]